MNHSIHPRFGSDSDERKIEMNSIIIILLVSQSSISCLFSISTPRESSFSPKMASARIRFVDWNQSLGELFRLHLRAIPHNFFNIHKSFLRYLRIEGRRGRNTSSFSFISSSFLFMLPAEADTNCGSHLICWQSTNMIIKPFISILAALAD